MSALVLPMQAFCQNETASTVTVGHYNDQDTGAAWDGFNMQNAPVIYTYCHSGSQVLYYPEELAAMKGKQITSISFKCFSEGCFVSNYTSNMKLYLQEIDERAFYYDEVGEYFEWVKFDKNNVIATAEFSADFLNAGINGSDVEVKFDLSKNPYKYSGKTLVVTVVNDSESYIDSNEGAVRFYWTDSQQGDSWRSFIFASDDYDYLTSQEKNNAVKPLENEDKWKNAPAVQFTYQEDKVTSFTAGDGTQANPYQISKLTELDLLNEWTNAGKDNGKYFKLVNDLTETAYSGFIATKGMFSGHFDGDNHTIKVNINVPDSSFVGLFGGVFGGSVKNLHVTGNVTGKMYVGGVIGQAANGAIIENVINSCNVNGKYYIGGIVGQLITQNNFPSCQLSQCANFGTVTGYTAGGIIGDAGQQVGNSIQRIANYGHIDGKGKSGGLIGNCRVYDVVKNGLSFGTGSEKVAGCIGNTISASISDIFYDGQLNEFEKANPVEKKLTTAVIGNAMKSSDATNGFSEKYWIFTENLYPRLKLNGFENSDIAKLYAAPVILNSTNTINSITDKFTAVTENGVVWSSKTGKVKFDGNIATPVEMGTDTLVATLNGVSRELCINITKLNSVEDVFESQNRVSTQQGAVVIGLVNDAKVQIYDFAGKTIEDALLTEGENTVELPAGVYIVRIGAEAHKVCVRN